MDEIPYAVKQTEITTAESHEKTLLGLMQQMRNDNPQASQTTVMNLWLPMVRGHKDYEPFLCEAILRLCAKELLNELGIYGDH
jgi:hypothetical protein